MPLHDYECPQGHISEHVQAAEQQTARCHCGEVATRVWLRAPAGFVAAEVRYTCPVTDKPITTRAAHEDNLRRHGCHVYERGEREATERRKAADERDFERRVDATCEQFVANLPSDKREQLGREVEAGATATVVR